MPRKTSKQQRARPAAARRFNEAAARCRGKRQDGRDDPELPGASMRPRPDAAENFNRSTIARHAGAGFNEAAARCRGKRAPAARLSLMEARFNEAAARCRGKRWNPTCIKCNFNPVLQ